MRYQYIQFLLYDHCFLFFFFYFQVTIRYNFIIKDTGLTPGTNDQAGQDAYNAAKANAEKTRTDIDNSLRTVNWGDFQASSGLELKDNNVDNFNLGQVEAYCSEDGAVIKKCDQADLNCWNPPCKCNKDAGSITKCSKYIKAFGKSRLLHFDKLQ